MMINIVLWSGGVGVRAMFTTTQMRLMAFQL